MTFNFKDFQTKVFFTSSDDLPVSGGDLLVFDGNTAPLFPERPIERSITLPPGEKAKNWSSVEAVLKRAVENGLERSSIFYGIGGGVVCDLTAFASSSYMRGCRLALVPTTLLSMVDASLGGKTGFDFMGGKNLIGSFYPAHELYICTDLLESLPEREYLSGLAEVIKTAMIGDSGLFSLLTEQKEAVLARDKDIINEMVSRSVKVKGSIVEKDLYEQGERAFLNLGHTFGHALEAATGFTTWSHGEAVAWGIMKALETGLLLERTDKAYAEEVRELLLSYGFKLKIPYISADGLLEAMNKDKKKKNGKLRFILQEKLTETFIEELEPEFIEKILIT